MLIDKVRLIYFSPTHTSAKIAHAIARGMDIPFVESDITHEAPKEIQTIEEDLTVVAVPVYGGRVPDIAVERLSKFHSNGKAVVLVSTYGNRHYDDALLELNDLVKRLGFVSVAAGAFVGEHSFSRKDLPIAEGRPDSNDLFLAEQFGKNIIDKFLVYNTIGEIPELKVKGNYPYKEKGPANPQAPITNEELCTRCEYCIDICPVQAISITIDDLMFSDPVICIKCSVCVKECPEDARSFDSPFAVVLHKNFSVRREPELFL